MSTARNHALEALRSVFDRPDTSESYDAMMDRVQTAIAALEAETGEPPVPQPYAWTVSASTRLWFGKHADTDSEIEARHCGGTCVAFPLYRGAS
jgi:hypothetical protein